MKIDQPNYNLRNRCARAWLRRGVPIVPLEARGKRPINGHSSLSPIRDREVLDRFLREHPSANYALITGNESKLIVIDVDGDEGHKSWRKFCDGRRIKTVTVMTGNGYHSYFWYDGPDISNSVGKLGLGIDVRGKGGYVVGPGSTHSGGASYEYANGLGPSTVEIAELPQWIARELMAFVEPRTLPPGETSLQDGERNVRLTSLAGRLQNSGLSREALAAALHAENTKRCQPPIEDDEVETIAKSVARYVPKPLGGDEAELLCRSVLNERYAGGTGLIYAVDGQFWTFDKTHWKPLPRKVLEGVILSSIEGAHAARRTTTAGLIQQTMRLLEASTATQNDVLGFTSTPLNIVNCLNGELWVGNDGSVTLQPHRPESYLRHCFDVNYQETATCPIYDEVVAEIFSKASKPIELERIWDELMGYSIQTKRKIPLIVVGSGNGNNGKTMLIKLLIRIIGHEQVVALAVQDLDKSRFAVGGLLGKLVYVDDDVKAGTRLPDGQLKKLSESKIVTGEHKFGPPFTFEVRTVVIMLCNSPPSLADLSHGMQRRLYVIPFERKFTDVEDDRSLFDRICASELSGILNRYLAGLKTVVQRGWRLNRPSDVKNATAEWLRDANPVPAFLDARCEHDDIGYVWMRELYQTFLDWAKETGITRPQQQNTFRRNLENLKFEVIHGNKGDKVIGLKLRARPSSTPRFGPSHR